MTKEIQEKIKLLESSKDEGMKELGRILQKEEKMKDNIGLDIIQRLQDANPLLIVGGSTSLYLNGIKLKRLYISKHDIDIILPYYFNWEGTENIENDQEIVKSHPSDFHYVLYTEGRTIDIRIDPIQRYTNIVFEDVKYKVALVEDVIAAKIRYIPTNHKHKDDLYEMLGIGDKNPISKESTLTHPYDLFAGS